MGWGWGPGLGWGIISIVGLTLLIGLVILKETNTHLYWRGLVAKGDVEAIRGLIENAMQGWRRSRPPRGIQPGVWASVQSVQLDEVTTTSYRLSTSVEGQYAMIEGERRLLSPPLEEAARVAIRLGEMALYDVPDLHIPWVQIDIYSTFRDARERPEQRCILSTLVDRETAVTFDWDGATPADLFDAFRARFDLDDGGVALPVTPFQTGEAFAER